MKEYKVGDVVTYMIRSSDWMRGPIVRGVRRRSSGYDLFYDYDIVDE